MFGFFLTFGVAEPDPKASSDSIITASVDDLFAGYDHWTASHPHILPKNFRLDMPSIDIYSPDGVLLFHSDDAQKNAGVVDLLPGHLPNVNINGAERPSLRDILEMYAGFRADENKLLKERVPTVISITYPTWDKCRVHNEAISKLRRRSHSGIRILEVQLHT